MPSSLHRTRVNRTIGNQQTTVHARDIQSMGNVATFVDRYRSLYPVQIGAAERHQRQVAGDDHLLISHSLFAELYRRNTNGCSDQLNTCPDCRKINYLPHGYNCFVSKNFGIPCWGICPQAPKKWELDCWTTFSDKENQFQWLMNYHHQKDIPIITLFL